MVPATPDYQGEQGYRLSAPEGVGASDVTAVAGADGAGVAIVDIEYNWVLDHEDLELDASANIDSAPLYDPYPVDEGNHGTAVLEILGGRPNAYGVTGLVPEATLLVAPAMTTSHGYNVARAVNLAAQILGPGDVILIEQQSYVCGGSNFGPVEWNPPVFDAIATATALGIVVVEAAGNGAVDLDAPACGGWFDRSVRDSGAIIVGAGEPGSRARLSFSSYGSRVDLQGGASRWRRRVTVRCSTPATSASVTRPPSRARPALRRSSSAPSQRSRARCSRREWIRSRLPRSASCS